MDDLSDAADLTRLAEALDDAARAREITALPSGWVRVSTGLLLFDGTGVDVCVRFLPDDRVRVSEVCAVYEWVFCTGMMSDERPGEAIAAMGESYGLDDDKTGWGVTVPLSEVAGAVDRVASFQVAMAGAWHGARCPTPSRGEAE